MTQENENPASVGALNRAECDEKHANDNHSHPASQGASELPRQTIHAFEANNDNQPERAARSRKERVGIQWYPRNIEDELANAAILKIDERGAFWGVIDLIYVHQNELIDDNHFIAGNLRIDVRMWKRIKRRLVEAGLLHVEDGYLRNANSNIGVDVAVARITQKRRAGALGGIQSAFKSNLYRNRVNDLAAADAQAGASALAALRARHTHKGK